MDIGQKLKEKRTQAGLTQEAVAERIGVSRQTVSNWENNRSYPDIVSILRLSDLYEVSLDEFLKEDANMRKHVEENAQTLKKIWNALCDLCVLVLVIAIFMEHFHWYSTAYLIYAVSAGLYTLLRLFVPKLFGGSWKLELLRIAEHILWIAWLSSYPYLNNLDVSWSAEMFQLSLLAALIAVNAYLSTQEKKVGNPTRTKPQSTPWTTMALVLTIPLLLLIADSDSPDSIPEPNPYAPFPSSYQVAEVLHTTTPEAELPYVRLAEGIRLHTTDPLTSGEEIYGILYLIDSEENTLYSGDLTELEVPAGNSALKGIWQTTPEEDSSLLYQVTVEADTSVTLSCYQGDSLQWKYLLEDMPRLKVGFSATANLMSWGERGNFHAVWYFGGTGYDHDTLKTVRETLGERTISFHPEFPVETLTVYEDYYRDGEMTTRELTILPAENGIFQMKAVPYDDSGTRYCIYRVPFKDGEFIFRVDFP